MDYTAIFILACILIPLERLTALHPDQGVFRKGWLNDVVYVLLNGYLIRAGFAVVVALTVYLYTHLTGGPPRSLVSDLPIWGQVILVIVVADIGYYTAHRLSHTVPFLWKFHSVHHSVEEMDWLAAHRIHPLDMVFTHTFSLLPQYFLGFSLEALLIFHTLYQAQTLFIHANTRLRFGPLKWLIASPEYHHWHHANEPEAYNCNFGAQLSLIDVIAGTMYLPERRPKAYGINDPMPETYPMQLLHPFRSLAKGFARRASARKDSRNERDA